MTDDKEAAKKREWALLLTDGTRAELIGVGAVYIEPLRHYASVAAEAATKPEADRLIPANGWENLRDHCRELADILSRLERLQTLAAE